MKNLYLFTLITCLLATGCRKDNMAKQSDYDASYKKWITYKATVNNSYKYTITHGSWTGYGADIETGVSNGKIVSRSFISYKSHQDGTGAIDTLQQWHEDSATLNTHGTEAGDMLTLDDIYLKARTQWLKVSAKSNDIYFEAKNNGLISSCGYVPHGCQDDCFYGITIKSIVAI